jgi:hypothetical protein
VLPPLQTQAWGHVGGPGRKVFARETSSSPRPEPFTSGRARRLPSLGQLFGAWPRTSAWNKIPRSPTPAAARSPGAYAEPPESSSRRGPSPSAFRWRTDNWPPVYRQRHHQHAPRHLPASARSPRRSSLDCHPGCPLQRSPARRPTPLPTSRLPPPQARRRGRRRRRVHRAPALQRERPPRLSRRHDRPSWPTTSTALPFLRVVPAGVAFLAAAGASSLDSRFFGPIPISDLTPAVPVWTY